VFRSRSKEVRCKTKWGRRTLRRNKALFENIDYGNSITGYSKTCLSRNAGRIIPLYCRHL